MSSDYYDEYWNSKKARNVTARFPPDVARTVREEIGYGSTCLDVGCGMGHKVLSWVNENGIAYTGMDISETAVEGARANGLQAVVIDDITRFPFGDCAFDATLCLEVLEHLVDPIAVAREIRRVLKPGGIAVITVPNGAHLRIRLQLMRGLWNPNGDALSRSEPWRDPHVRFFALATLDSMLRQAGFTDVEVGGHQDHIDNYSSSRVRVLTNNQLYSRLRGRWPSVFAGRLHAIVRKPDAWDER